MTEQPTFADLEYQAQEATDPSGGVSEADSLIPWERLEEPSGPTTLRLSGVVGLTSAMLRVQIVQLCYNVSDPGMEDLLYEAESVRRFAGLRLSEPIPDESTILNFRHLLEERHLGQGLFAEINEHLASQGLRLREGTIVDATIIEAPPSTKNPGRAAGPGDAPGEEGEPIPLRDEAAHRGGFGDGLSAQLRYSSANVHDVTQAHRLLHGGERQVWGDAGYIGVQKREEHLELGPVGSMKSGRAPDITGKIFQLESDLRRRRGVGGHGIQCIRAAIPGC